MMNFDFRKVGEQAQDLVMPIRKHRHDGAGNMDDRFRVLRRRGETAEKKRTSGWLRGFHRWIFH